MPFRSRRFLRDTALIAAVALIAVLTTLRIDPAPKSAHAASEAKTTITTGAVALRGEWSIGQGNKTDRCDRVVEPRRRLTPPRLSPSGRPAP